MSEKKIIALICVWMATLFAYADVTSEKNFGAKSDGAPAVNLEQVREKLTSPFHERLLRGTYDSIRGRIADDGYFPESLTGAYAGMFPRVVGALAQLLMETGEPDCAEQVIHYCIQGMLDNDMERIPHVLHPRDDTGRIPLRCDEDQIDGQASVILAWALLAKSRGRTPYEDLSYPIVATLMDQSTLPPYFMAEPTGGRNLPGLVRNMNLEHSRDAHFWDAYDFLTQSFVASALENMIHVANRRMDASHAERWSDTLARLNANVAKHMIRNLNGETIYLEMLLPTDPDPIPFPGLGWLNLAPIPSGWRGVDTALFNNTIETWRRVARIDWDGPAATSSDWLPKGHVDASGNQQSNMVIGKVLGWDMLHAMQNEQYGVVSSSLDFLERTNKHSLFAEAFSYDPDTAEWRLNDPGTGEQACWWTWAMTRIRKQAGLPLLPKPAVAQGQGGTK